MSTANPPSISAAKAAKTLKLITKLLAKAENTPYPEEALTFQEHAERLMVRYGIEQATVDAEAGKAGQPRETMVEHRVVFTGSYRIGQTRGFTSIAHAFNSVRVLESTGRTTKSLFLIGAESDVEQISRLIDSLRVQMESAMQAWWLSYLNRPFLSAHERTLERRQFQLGFLTSVAERIRAIHVSETLAAEPGQALVLANRIDRASTHVAELYPRLRNARKSNLSAGSAQSMLAGAEAGLVATVNGAIGD